MYINMKKIFRYGVLLMIGLSMMFYGMIELVIKDHSKETPSDAEVIRRARELGMVGIDEKILKEYETDE